MINTANLNDVFLMIIENKMNNNEYYKKQKND